MKEKVKNSDDSYVWNHSQFDDRQQYIGLRWLGQMLNVKVIVTGSNIS